MNSTTLISLLLFIWPILAIDSEYHFKKKVQDGKRTIVKDGTKETIMVKKVFIKLYIDIFKSRQKKIFGCREDGQYKALFVFTCCEKMGKTVSPLTSVV